MSGGASWDIEFAPQARKELARLPPEMRPRIGAAINALRQWPDVEHTRKLQGEVNVWRLRVGEWRVRFTPSGETRTIIVLRVLPRDKAYRD